MVPLTFSMVPSLSGKHSEDSREAEGEGGGQNFVFRAFRPADSVIGVYRTLFERSRHFLNSPAQFSKR